MARKKISEFKAKSLLFDSLDMPYSGIQVSGNKLDLEKKLSSLDKTKNYVVKVDQGVKGRMKKGLVEINISPYKLKSFIRNFATLGYSQFLIEEFVPHEQLDEKYFALDRTREGIAVYFSPLGGVEIEKNQDLVKKIIIPYSSNEVRTFTLSLSKGSQPSVSNNKEIHEITTTLQIPQETFQKILSFFDQEYISFLEVNPFVILNSTFTILDLAVEVDSAAEFFIKDWSTKDFVEGPDNTKTEEEKNIIALQAKSMASLKLQVLNSNGSIFVMLFGGGGSIVIADEIYNQGFGKELANFGDYSGGPNAQETYIYVKNLVNLLLKSRPKADHPLDDKSPRKVFLIAGGVANFTDVGVTLRGVVAVLKEYVSELRRQGIKVFVRRPGPNQTEGLAEVQQFLLENNLFGGVWDQTMVLSDVVSHAVGALKLT